MIHPLPINHSIYGAGVILDYRNGEALFAFPGSLKVWEKSKPPSEIIWRSHREFTHGL